MTRRPPKSRSGKAPSAPEEELQAPSPRGGDGLADELLSADESPEEEFASDVAEALEDELATELDAPPEGGDAENLPRSGEPTDHDLIRGAQGGDEHCFELLVKRWERRAWRVARNMVPSEEDARDLAQEAFLRVFKSLERFDFKHEFATWLYRIVTNLCIDHLRKRRPTLSSSSSGDDDDDERAWSLPDDSVAGPSEDMERRELVAQVRDCIGSLAPHFQSVLVLRELEGLPCTEIADIVGATHVTVRWRLHRGRKLFQEEWERRERLRESRPGPGPSAHDGGSAGEPTTPPGGSADGRAR